MKTVSQVARLTMAIAALAGLAACADAPNAPAAVQTAAVAASFDAIAQQEALAGAPDRSDDWRWVAKAIRAGVEPSRVEIWTYGKMEEYNAFVRAIEAPAIQTGPRRDPGHVMMAWQRNGGEAYVDHAVRLWSPGDNGRIVPRAGIEGGELPLGAHVDYLERGNALSPYLGFTGIAQVAERWAGGRCHIDRPPELERLPEGVICQKAHFAVRFEATFRPMHEEVGQQSHTMVMWMAEQKVVGVKFTPGN